MREGESRRHVPFAVWGDARTIGEDVQSVRSEFCVQKVGNKLGNKAEKTMFGRAEQRADKLKSSLRRLFIPTVF